MATMIDGIPLLEWLKQPLPESACMPEFTEDDLEPGEGPFWVYLTNRKTGVDFVKKFHSPPEQEKFVNKVMNDRSKKVAYRFMDVQPHWS